MSKARMFMAGTVLSGLVGFGTVMIPAGAASADTTTTSTTSSTDPLLTVCLTVTPKSLDLGINGQDVAIGPAGVQRTCIATPF